MSKKPDSVTNTNTTADLFRNNIVPFIKKYINIKNNIMNNNVPPAKANANNAPRINNGIPIYCIINGKNVV